MKITKKRLLNKGYDEWKPNHFQKCFREYHKTHTSKRYFININYFNIPIRRVKLEGFTLKVQFQNVIFNKKEICYNVEFDCTNLSIEDIEKFIEQQWINLGKPYYEKYC